MLKLIRRFFNLLLGAMAMLTVALVSAFLSMRFAIHGREVEVPRLSGLTISEASEKAAEFGLNLHLENKFYSIDVPSGHILAQYPAPGARVRRDWTIRITESLGAQQVSIPDVLGQPERPASLSIRRLSLDVGTVAPLLAGGDTGTVLAQTPGANAEGIDRPRVSFLVSQSPSASPEAFVMPQLTGLPLSSAYARAGAAGLRVVTVAETAPIPIPGATPFPAGAFTAGPSALPQVSLGSSAPTSAMNNSAIVATQSPLAGHRVMRGEAVRVTLVQ